MIGCVVVLLIVMFILLVSVLVRVQYFVQLFQFVASLGYLIGVFFVSYAVGAWVELSSGGFVIYE